MVRGQTPGKLKPALTPEHEVHQDNLRPEFLCPSQRLSRGSGNADDAQAFPFQVIAGGLHEQPAVIHNQDTEPRHVNSVPASTMPRIGASRNRKSRDLTADPVPGKDIPAAGTIMSALQAKRTVQLAADAGSQPADLLVQRFPIALDGLAALGDLAWRVPGEAGHAAVRNQRLRMFNLVRLR